MRHYHFNPEANEFQAHEHLHSGPHQHAWDLESDESRLRVMKGEKPIMLTVKIPGNYAPSEEATPS